MFVWPGHDRTRGGATAICLRSAALWLRRQHGTAGAGLGEESTEDGGDLL